MEKLESLSERPPGNRLVWGGIVFISGFLSPLLIPFVLATNLSPGLKSLFSGLLALGIPEVFMLIAVAILGKSGFAFLKNKMFSVLKRYGPPDTVSKMRYRFGLVLFTIPLLLGLLLPYFWNMIPFIKQNLFLFLISGDAMLFLSLFVLGGNFWDKLRSLFVYNSRAMLINDRSNKINQND